MDQNTLPVFLLGGLIIFFILYTTRRFIQLEKTNNRKPLTPKINTSHKEVEIPVKSSGKEEIPERTEIQKPPKLTIGKDVKIELVEGIGPKYAKKLKSISISRTSHLLEAGSTPYGIKKINEATGIYSKLINKWVTRADLLRIQGVDNEYSGLLEEAGVYTVNELAEKDSRELYELLLKITNPRRSPSVEMINRWIRIAKELQIK
jgi:predicted flap endonuclease-1-like 5' DNA nuclease